MPSQPLFPADMVPPPPNWFRRRVLNATDPAGATAAVRQLFAARDASSVPHERVTETMVAYGAETSASQVAIARAVFRDAVRRLGDQATVEAVENSAHFQAFAKSLRIPREIAERAVLEAREDIVRGYVERALADRRFSEQERTDLEELASRLGLSDRHRSELLRAVARPILLAAVDGAAADHRYSPKEEQELAAFAESLGVSLDLDDAARASLARFRLMWRIENGDLPEIFAPLALQRGERCHFSTACSWRELRTRTVRVDYAGVSSSIRIMKGVRFRLGSIVPRRVTETDLVEVASGTLYVTNKRLLLDGHGSNKAVTWRSAFGQELFADAIKIEKSAGKDPYLFIAASELELASVVIAAAMNAAG